MWLLMGAAEEERTSLPWWFGIGCVIGLGSLTKYSILLTPIPALFFLIPYMRRNGIRHSALAAIVGLAGILITSGFWHLHNLFSYGEIVPLRQMAVAIPTLLRPQPLSSVKLVSQLPWLINSYWGVFT
jgi:4-amino-4-deoxy-L-arabinose transferase-like glycosyltransferase